MGKEHKLHICQGCGTSCKAGTYCACEMVALKENLHHDCERLRRERDDVRERGTKLRRRVEELKGLLKWWRSHYRAGESILDDTDAALTREPPAPRRPAGESNAPGMVVTELGQGYQTSEPPEPENKGERCQDCGSPYLTIYRVPDEVWAKVTPKEGEGGLLCPECCDRRARDAGITLYWEADYTFPSEAEAVGSDGDLHKLWARRWSRKVPAAEPQSIDSLIDEAKYRRATADAPVVSDSALRAIVRDVVEKVRQEPAAEPEFTWRGEPLKKRKPHIHIEPEPCKTCEGSGQVVHDPLAPEPFTACPACGGSGEGHPRDGTAPVAPCPKCGEEE